MNPGCVTILVSDADSVDFIQGVTSFSATDASGKSVVWRIPTRLVGNEQITCLIVDELVKELDERIVRDRKRSGKHRR